MLCSSFRFLKSIHSDKEKTLSVEKIRVNETKAFIMKIRFVSQCNGWCPTVIHTAVLSASPPTLAHF